MDSDGPTTGKPSASRYMQDAEVRSWSDKAMERWRLWLVVLVVAIIGIYYFSGRSSTDSAATASATAGHAAVPVAAVPAKLGDLKQYISAIGTVTAYNTVTVKSRVDGQLNTVNFTEGQIVKAGDVLAQIDPRPYQVELTQAEGTLAKDLASLENAKVTLARDKELFDQKVLARQDLDNQEAAVGQYAGSIESDKGAVDSAKLQPGLQPHHFADHGAGRAPAGGPGQYRSRDRRDRPGGDHAAAADRGRFQHSGGRPAQPRDRDEGQPAVAGRGLRSRPQAPSSPPARCSRSTTRSIRRPARSSSRRRFPIQDNALFPNQFVNARLLVDTIRNATLIPAAALQRSQQGTFVYVVKPDKTVEMRPVTVGATQGEVIAISKGRHGRRHGRYRRRGQAAAGLARECADRGIPPRERHSMNLSRPFILRPVATSLLMVGLLLAGLVAYGQLPVSALPQVDYPTIQVMTFYPGGSPDVMASSVTAPLERQFGQVPGLKQMTSNSSFGSSVITLQFDLNLNIDVAEQEVQAAINAAATYLPTDLPNPPIYSKTNPADTPILTLALTSKELPLDQVEDLRRHAPGREDLATARRRPGEHRRRPEAGGPRAGQSRPRWRRTD